MLGIVTLRHHMQDKRREEERAESQSKKQLAHEAARAELARDLTNEVHNLCGMCACVCL